MPVQQMVLIEPFALSFGGVAPNYTLSRGTNAANMIEPDPREIWIDTGAAGTYQIDIDLGVATDWDFIGLVNVTALSTATWAISGCATYTATNYLAAIAMRLPSEDGTEPSGPAYYLAAAPINGRYIRITITPGAAPINSIGYLGVGKSWKPSMPREQGAGRPPIETGVRSRLDNGGLAVVTGHLLSGFKWVFGDLDPSDLRKLWGMYRRRRTTEPLFLIEDPGEPYAEVFHYGTFIELELWAREDASKSRQAMTFEDWN